MTTFEEAQRYVDLARSGWTDPEVDVLDLIQSLVTAHETSRQETYTIDEHESALKDAVDSATEHLVDPDDADERAEFVESLTITELVEALQGAIERERRAVREDAQVGVRSVVAARNAEIAQLKRQLEDTQIELQAANAVLQDRTRRSQKKKPEAAVLPNIGVKVTKKSTAIMERFNRAIGAMVVEHGGERVDGDEDSINSILGYAYCRYSLETRVGRVEIMPSGYAIHCRFEEPDRAARLINHNLRTARVSGNARSGKFNTYYCGQKLDDAVAAFRDTLDLIASRETTEAA